MGHSAWCGHHKASCTEVGLCTRVRLHCTYLPCCKQGHTFSRCTHLLKPVNQQRQPNNLCKKPPRTRAMQIRQQRLALAGRYMQFLTAVSRGAVVILHIPGVKPAGGKEERTSKVSPAFFPQHVHAAAPWDRDVSLGVEELTKKLEKWFGS